MAVRALPRSHARAPLHVAGLPPAILLLTLAAPALDLLGIVQPVLSVSSPAMVASAAATLVLLVFWARYPRTSWLFAAALASIAGLSMRLVGADVAPLLSLLSIVALGVGGAFASGDVNDVSLGAV